jgi:hypothetical protein
MSDSRQHARPAPGTLAPWSSTASSTATSWRAPNSAAARRHQADFLRDRDLDALGTDPLGAYQESIALCASAFGHPGALDRMLDHPLGKITGAQALAVRVTTQSRVLHLMGRHP